MDELKEKKGEEKNKAPAMSFVKIIRNYCIMVAAVMLLTTILFHTILFNAYIPTESMEDTLMTGDRAVGLRLSYKTKDPERGDVVIFLFPDDKNTYFIKRIIGLPGDTVEIKDGKVYVNGEILDEPYLKEEMEKEEYMKFEVPDDSYFVLGDNRNSSYDARYWENTYVPKEDIQAKALFKYYKGFKIIK